MTHGRATTQQPAQCRTWVKSIGGAARKQSVSKQVASFLTETGNGENYKNQRATKKGIQRRNVASKSEQLHTLLLTSTGETKIWGICQVSSQAWEWRKEGISCDTLKGTQPVPRQLRGSEKKKLERHTQYICIYALTWFRHPSRAVIDGSLEILHGNCHVL